MEPKPSYSLSTAPHRAEQELTPYRAASVDGRIPNGWWSTTPQDTNVEVYVQNSGKGTMTYGILHSALAGLSSFMSKGYNWVEGPFVFQVNDGE